MSTYARSSLQIRLRVGRGSSPRRARRVGRGSSARRARREALRVRLGRPVANLYLLRVLWNADDPAAKHPEDVQRSVSTAPRSDSSEVALTGLRSITERPTAEDDVADNPAIAAAVDVRRQLGVHRPRVRLPLED